MSLRCRLGLHDWRFISYEDPGPGDDPRVLFRRHVGCQRCHDKRTLVLKRLQDDYIPPGGVPVAPDGAGVFHWPPMDLTIEESMLTCVRPGTREHGVKRDGSKPVNTACNHLYRNHGRVMYFGDGKYGFISGECHDCSCEGFLG